MCSATPIAAPTSCAITKPGTLGGAMPAKVLENMRPNAAAGLAAHGGEFLPTPEEASNRADLEALVMLTSRAEGTFDFGEVWQGRGFTHDLLAAALCK